MLTTTWERDSTGLGYYLDYFELLAGLRLLAPGKPRANRPLKVYRGIAEAAEPQEAVAGLSWTSSARVAAFFALRYSASHAAGIACVFEAEVPAKLVLGRFNGRREQEVLVHPDFFVDAETNGALRVEGRSVPITSWGDFAVSSTELARWQRLADRYRQGMQWHIHAPTHK